VDRVYVTKLSHVSASTDGSVSPLASSGV
jgi:hypothetical protein